MAVSAYEVISTQTLGSAVTTVTFSSIPQTYTDLVLVCSTKPSSSAYLGYIKLNNDATSLYSETLLYGTGSVAGSARESNRTSGYVSNWTTANSTSLFTVFQIHFMNYANTSIYKTYIARSSDAGTEVNASVNLYRSTSAITQIAFSVNTGNLDIGSTFTLYGIKAA